MFRERKALGENHWGIHVVAVTVEHTEIEFKEKFGKVEWLLLFFSRGGLSFSQRERKRPTKQAVEAGRACPKPLLNPPGSRRRDRPPAVEQSALDHRSGFTVPSALAKNNTTSHRAHPISGDDSATTLPYNSGSTHR